MNLSSKVWGAVLLSFGVASTARALVIDFEGHVPQDDGAAVQDQDGFRFTFSAAGWGIFTDSFVGGGAPYTSNGTERLMLAGGSPGQVTMQAIDGSLFSLTGLDAATMFPGFSGTIDITGFRSGGGTVSQSLGVSDSFSSFLINPGFTSLISAIFAESVSGAYRTTPGLALDNIAIDESAVPVPATLALVGVGLAGIGHRNRKHFR